MKREPRAVRVLGALPRNNASQSHAAIEEAEAKGLQELPGRTGRLGLGSGD